MAINNSINTLNLPLSLTSGTGTISIGADATSKTINIGSSSGTTAVNINNGSGVVNVATTGSGAVQLGNLTSTSITLLASGGISLGTSNSYTGAISIGNSVGNPSFTVLTGIATVNISSDATANAINLATGAGVKTLTIGSTNSTSSTTIHSGTGALNIGTSIAKTITIGNATGATGIVLTTGSSGTVFTGFAEGALITSSAGKVSTVTGTAGYVLTANASGTAPSFQPAGGGGGGFAWNNTTGSTQSMSVGNGYVDNGSGTPTVYTLPSTAVVGSLVAVQGAGAGLWKIAQNSGQSISFNAVTSTSGTGGSVSSTDQFDAITLICITANTVWAVNQSVGNFNVV